MSSGRTTTPLLIVFMDLTRFAAEAWRADDADLADTIDAYYERIGVAVRLAGGTVVKFIGDAALVVFPEPVIDGAVRMLLQLKDDVDRTEDPRPFRRKGR